MSETKTIILEVINQLADSIIEQGASKACATIDLGSASDDELEIYIEVRRKTLEGGQDE